CRDFIFVAVGTGVGMALFLNGALYRGGRFAAGELGHILIDPAADAPTCACGRTGCLEAIASGPAMAARFRQLAGQAGLGAEACSADLARMAAWLTADDPHGELARAVVSAGAQALGKGLSIAANLFDPQRIVLGGGVARLGSVWQAGVRAGLAHHTLRPLRESDIHPPRLGDDSALAGALALARALPAPAGAGETAAGRENRD
ncbi:MAG TPA: ROK family protein, partial [Anaerolineaceae bacterium]|nr:ROK family protein [Anaerolineaceae bacterium]